MNNREKLLAAVVGSLVLLLVGKFVLDKVVGAFTTQHNRIAELEKTVRNQDRTVKRARRAAQEMGENEKRSLPRDLDQASSVYRAWLVEWVERAQLTDYDVKFDTFQPHKDVYTELQFSVSGDGDLAQVTRMLHDFYSVDLLHRIKRLSMAPIRDSKQLNLTFTIEALALAQAQNRDKLEPGPSNRLSRPALDDYLHEIVGRNVFSPANNPPAFASTSTQRVSRGLFASIGVSANAGDQDQKVTYRLVSHTIPGAEPQMDANSGTVRFTPTENGEFEMQIEATDDGLPPKSATTVVKIEVGDPPPPVEAPAGPPSFDIAKFAFVTGIVEVNGRPQLWLTIRTEGKVLYLGEGDQFKVGDFEALVDRIGLREIELTSEGQKWRVRQGQSLSQAELVAQDATRPTGE